MAGLSPRVPTTLQAGIKRMSSEACGEGDVREQKRGSAGTEVDRPLHCLKAANITLILTAHGIYGCYKKRRREGVWKGGKNEEGWGRPPREKAQRRGSLSPVHGGLCDRHRLQKMFLNFPSSGAGAVHTRRAFRDGSDLVPTVRCGEPRSRRPTADRRELRPSDPRAQRGADPDPAGGRTNATLPSAPRISRRGWTATDFFKRKRESSFLRLGRRTISLRKAGRAGTVAPPQRLQCTPCPAERQNSTGQG